MGYECCVGIRAMIDGEAGRRVECVRRLSYLESSCLFKYYYVCMG